MDARNVSETFGLYVTRFDDALTDGFTRFAARRRGQFFNGHRHHFHLNVNAVEQRTRDFVEVTVDLSWRADTFVVGMIIVATGTRVH